jgi:hypothetical protein
MAIKLKSPLSERERLQFIRLIGHDAASSVFNIQINARDKKFEGSHIRAVMSSVDELSSEDLYLDRKYASNNFRSDGSALHGLMKKLVEIFPGELKTSVRNCHPFLGPVDSLYTILFNLIKNSKSACGKNILLESDLASFPSEAIYIPEGARDYKKFIAFYVKDNGWGFPLDIPLLDRLTLCPPRGKHGFGLYFTGLAARVLRAPVDIKSSPGDTTVAFYHPIYEEATR